MPVVVPSAPDVQETTRMLEDSESVSFQGRRPSQDAEGASQGLSCAGGTGTLCWPRSGKQPRSEHSL